MFTDHFDLVDRYLVYLAREHPDFYDKLWENGNNPYCVDLSFFVDEWNRLTAFIKKLFGK
jgi:hypothetical protein